MNDARPPKSTPGDWQLLDDENAPVHERASAMTNLCADGHSERLVRHAEAWLTHEKPLLRMTGAKLLLLWRGSTEHLPVAFEMLHADPSWWVRPGVADLLIGRSIFNPQTGDEIMCHLVQQLEAEQDDDVQLRIYEVLLRALFPQRADRPKVPSDADRWDRQRDVDWALLAPWRDSAAK